MGLPVESVPVGLVQLRGSWDPGGGLEAGRPCGGDHTQVRVGFGVLLDKGRSFQSSAGRLTLARCLSNAVWASCRVLPFVIPSLCGRG